MKSSIIKDKKILAKIYMPTMYNATNIDKNVLIDQITKNIRVSSVGYAGFSKKKHLKEFLYYQIFDKDIDLKKTKKKNINQREIKEIIDKTIRKCKKALPSQATKIFVFPSYNSFIQNKMNGSSGYAPWQNTILVFINPSARRWKTSLESTITHEYLHAITRQYHKWETLLDSVVFEGLAENFVQDVLGNKLSLWSQTLDLKQSKAYLKKIKSKLNSKDIILYKSLFFGNKDYPLWTGYSIGYHLVRSFLNTQSIYHWEQIIKLKPKTILMKSKLI